MPKIFDINCSDLSSEMNINLYCTQLTWFGDKQDQTAKQCGQKDMWVSAARIEGGDFASTDLVPIFRYITHILDHNYHTTSISADNHGRENIDILVRS